MNTSVNRYLIGWSLAALCLLPLVSEGAAEYAETSFSAIGFDADANGQPDLVFAGDIALHAAPLVVGGVSGFVAARTGGTSAVPGGRPFGSIDSDNDGIADVLEG